MSLFKCREWWSTRVVEREGDSGCFCVGSVDNGTSEDDSKSGGCLSQQFIDNCRKNSFRNPFRIFASVPSS